MGRLVDDDGDDDGDDGSKHYFIYLNPGFNATPTSSHPKVGEHFLANYHVLIYNMTLGVL